MEIFLPSLDQDLNELLLGGAYNTPSLQTIIVLLPSSDTIALTFHKHASCKNDASKILHNYCYHFQLEIDQKATDIIIPYAAYEPSSGIVFSFC